MSDIEQTIENRRHPRKSLDVLVNYKKTQIARSKDISQGGIGLICDEALPVGTFLNLVFFLPNKEEIKTIGKVKWTRKASASYWESGIEFWQLDDSIKDKLLAFLQDDID
jgi:hypothetical protein